MRHSRFSLIACLTIACMAIAATARSAVAFARDFIKTILLAVDPRAVADLFRSDDQMAFNGPASTPIGSTLARDQRHEAGLARLGAVRHR